MTCGCFTISLHILQNRVIRHTFHQNVFELFDNKGYVQERLKRFQGNDVLTVSEIY